MYSMNVPHKRRHGCMVTRFAAFLMAGLSFFGAGHAQSNPQAAPHQLNAVQAAEPHTLYVVPYAHLDTEWRWEYPQVINEFLPRTMRDNFALFEKYPHYIFNFSGANRYRLMKEYDPDDYERLKRYVAAGRWFPAGSSMEENDVNNPSAESIIRQILYGKEYFRKDFGKTSAEYMLPDCFGFPASLPSILAHAGIKGFSTQKLSWHSGARVGGPDSPQKTPVGIPFNVGVWQGPDGHSVVAALNATNYGGDVTEDLSKSPTWIARNDNNGASSGDYIDYRYYGTGDTGGAPDEDSVRLMEAIVTKGMAVLPTLDKNGDPLEVQPTGPAVRVGDGPLHVEQTTAEKMFLNITPAQAARLPHYSGDLELTEHSAGSLTSEAYQKRWNRKNELLAAAAESTSVAADWMGARTYPMQRLTNAWTLVMGGEFHDLIPGTATPKAFEFAWNDEVLAMNQFAQVLTSAVDAVSEGLDTRSVGTPIVVYNPLNVAREDVVEANVAFPGGEPKAIRALSPDGKSAPAQIVSTANGVTKVLFLADLPSFGYAVYDLQPVESDSATASVLKVSSSSLENARYRLLIDEHGDVSSLFDKRLNREMLSAPMRLAISTDKPSFWPAWNIDWSDQQRAPRAYFEDSPAIKIVENGPVRIALEIRREAEGSTLVQTIRLSAGGAGDRVEFANAIDWRTKEAHLKATFPLTASNPEATYNWDIGTIERGNDDEKKYEVPSHQWIDLTDKSGAFGFTVLTDCKNGSDKPSDNTLRLTLLRTPGVSDAARAYSDQSSQDWGHHEFVYGVASHDEGWRQAQTDWQAQRLNQPLIAFASSEHPGALGKQFSLLSVSSSRVRVLALKKAEASNEIVVRLVELDGKQQQNVHIRFPSAIASAREINGAEEAVGPVAVTHGQLAVDFGPYQPRSFAITLAAPPVKLPALQSQSVSLDYDRSVTSRNGRPADGSFEDSGKALPAEMLPSDVSYNGIHFHLAPAGNGKPNALTALGQTLNLPGGFNTVYLFAASAQGDRHATFYLGNQPVDLTIQDWSGFVGQWDDRQWKSVEIPMPPEPAASDTSREAQRARRIRKYIQENGPITTEEFAGLKPGFIKPAPVAWFSDHLHNTNGENMPYAYSYLFAYRIEIPDGAATLKLPYDPNLRILAVSVAKETSGIHPVQTLTDNLPQGPVSETQNH
jgi:alpha-mannosidase